MTKNEVKTLSPGSKLQLANGQIVTVQSVDQGSERITFQYVEGDAMAAPKADELLIPGGFAGIIIQTDKLVDGGTPPAPPTSPPVQALIESAASTTITCNWGELASAVKLEAPPPTGG